LSRWWLCRLAVRGSPRRRGQKQGRLAAPSWERQKIVGKGFEEKECSAEPDLLMMRMRMVQTDVPMSGMLSILIPETPRLLAGRAAHTFGRNPPWPSATKFYRWSEAVATDKSRRHSIINPSGFVRCASTAIFQTESGLGQGPNSILTRLGDWLHLKSTVLRHSSRHESSRVGSAPSRGLEFATPDGSIMFIQTMPKRCFLPRAIESQGFSTAAEACHSWTQSLCLTSSLG
jgi:hypothetical protein